MAKLRHEYFSQDYQDLQKEFVSKMEMRQEAKERKQTFWTNFLRERYEYLMELQSRGTRTKEVLGVEDTGMEEWNNSASKAVSEHSLPVLEREEDKAAEGMEEANLLRPGEQVTYMKSSLKSNKRAKKVVWQDLEGRAF
ncbi:hypothetical protein ACJRO7_014701 [Eucalyptus globulus]|uniref:Uncharacterized protein n=1 Tax=Eucalyptus globulus TaxID=34317 RepID=A0ABD3L121_EUCGL